MKNISVSLILFSVLFITGCSFTYDLSRKEREYLESKGTITFVSQRRYPPFEFLNIHGNSNGIAINLIRWMELEYGFEASFLHRSFDRGKKMVLSGEADVLTTMFYSKERDKNYDFTNTVAEIPASMFVRAENSAIKNIQDLNGKKVAIQKGDFALSFLEQAGIEYTPVYTDNFEEAANRTLHGISDATVSDEQVVLYYLKNQDLMHEMKIAGDPLYVGNDCMAVAEGNSILISILNKAIGNAKQTGTLEKIKQRWLGTETDFKYKRYAYSFAFILLIFIVILSVIWFFNRSLKKQIKEKTMEIFNQKNLLQTAFDNLPDAIITTDTKRIVNYANAGVFDTLGYTPEELIGKGSYIYYSDINQYIKAGEMIFDKNSEKSSFEYTITYKHKNGNIFTGQTFGAKLFDYRGEWIGNIIAIKDISEREKHLKQIESLNYRLSNRHRLDQILIKSQDFGTLCNDVAVFLMDKFKCTGVSIFIRDNNIITHIIDIDKNGVKNIKEGRFSKDIIPVCFKEIDIDNAEFKIFDKKHRKCGDCEFEKYNKDGRVFVSRLKHDNVDLGYFKVNIPDAADENLFTTIKEFVPNLSHSVAGIINKDKQTRLLNELYHRTGNSLQVLQSMIQLKNLETEKWSKSEILKEINSNIYAMSLAHQKLYESKNYNFLDIKSYLESLTNYIIQFADITSSVNMQLEDMDISIDSAIPIGTVYSEILNIIFVKLYSNITEFTVKSSVKNSEECVVSIIIPASGHENVYERIKNECGLGLEIIENIIKSQLKGDLSVDYAENTVTINFSFNKDYYYIRV